MSASFTLAGRWRPVSTVWYHNHGVVKQVVAFTHRDATPTGCNIDQAYGSAVGDAFLRYM
jgi:hypothetical protein